MPIKFLADENISRSLIEFLRKEGYDIKDIKEEKLYGISDEEVIRLALRDKRIILTHDREFGGVLNNPINFERVVIIRYSNQNPNNIVKRFKADLVKIRSKLDNSVIVLFDKHHIIYEKP